MFGRGGLDLISFSSFWNAHARERVCRIHMVVVENLGICVDADKMMRRKWEKGFVACCYCCCLDWSCFDDDLPWNWHWHWNCDDY